MFPQTSSFELEVVPVGRPSLRKPASREEHSFVGPEQAFWESESIAVCKVNAAGEIVQANRTLLKMIQVPDLVPGMLAAEVLAKSGTVASVTVESIRVGRDGERLWILVPVPSADIRSNIAFRLLHDSVAQSVAALAMNLFLVQQSGATSTSPNAEKILRASLELVEQCAKEVRGICTLLQRQSKQTDLNCA